MDCFVGPDDSCSVFAPYVIVSNALAGVPMWHYVAGCWILCVVFLYAFLEFHFFRDLFLGFRGTPVVLTHHPFSAVYDQVVSNCKGVHGRYLPTPWLCSPHLQTCYLNFFGRPPKFRYRRQLFHASDGGTIALDWLANSDVMGGSFHMNKKIPKDSTIPIVIVIPGLTSDSTSSYMKHLAFNAAKLGRNVVICNHRGLGGISVTSDCFYNAGWTEDVRAVINYLHQKYQNAPLFAVGTSIGANILVKYLGEDGEGTPVAGAAAICNPWDLLIGDRFICRQNLQKLYDKALTIGLQGHEPQYSRLANWEGIKKSRSIRDFDKHATCLIGKYETVDTYYRHCSSASYVKRVAIPLLCINSLDDPVCSREAIPWDECRINENVVLVTSRHGGHLAFFEGITASKLWWVKVVNEFLGVLHSSSCMHVQKMQANCNGEEETPKETQNSIEMNSSLTPDGGAAACTRRSENQISKNRRSTWLLLLLTLVAGWPFVGPPLAFFLRNRLRKHGLLATLLRN